MNKEAIDLLIQSKPKLASSRHILEKMKSGAYCIHRSFGFGQIKEYDTANNRLIIDFIDGDKASHPMDPAFCIDKLEFLSADNLLVRQRTEPEVIEDMVKKNPVELVIEVLSSSPEGTMFQTELERFLSRLLGEAKFKKWWATTKKLLVRDPRIAVPVKKNDPYVLRDEPLTSEQEVLEEFYANKHPKKKILLAEKLYLLSNSVEEIASDLPRILEELTDAVKMAKKLNQAERLHGVWVRNDLARHLCEDVETLEPTSTSIIKESDNLAELAEELPSSYYKRFLDLISRVYPEDWKNVSINLLRNSSGKFTNECISFLMEKGFSDAIAESFQKWLNEQALRGPVLYWIVKNRNTRRFNKLTKDLINTRLLTATFHAIDNEALLQTGNKRILLADILSEDQELIPDLLSDANYETARDLAQMLMLNQGFEDLSKKSLLARFIRIFPRIQSLVAGESNSDSSEKDKLVVSEESFKNRKKEYEILISQKIPENKAAIAEAREHGDLRENSEYKMARQDQETLLARKALLESELSRAAVTNFEDATMDNVGIGSVVVLKDGKSNKSQEFAILGAWDSKPEENIVSYKTPLGQSLLSKKVGDVVKTTINGNDQTWTICSIDRWVSHKKA